MCENNDNEDRKERLDYLWYQEKPERLRLFGLHLIHKSGFS
jgi:hypothetical protein